jgi:glycosyltransferase involved in cell wall biosynthesis
MTWSGSEQVAARIATVSRADQVFTFAADPAVAARTFPGHTVTTSRVGRSKLLRRRWKFFLPVMSRWWKRLALDGFDLIITISHATVNSVNARDDAVHLSYCCTPMRYAWFWRSELARVPGVIRPIWPLVAAWLRATDRKRSRNVTSFIAVSEEVRTRIRDCYQRESVVIYPPVDTDFFTMDDDVSREPYYLYAGRLVGYKRPDVAVRAAGLAGVPLVVAGEGPESRSLEGIAGDNVRFTGAVTSEELRTLYRRATALVFPGFEDFGMVMVEAQACGTPVIAFDGGGVREAVRDGETGTLYADPTPEGLADALASFDPRRFDPPTIRQHAERFSIERFDSALRSVLDELVGADDV